MKSIPHVAAVALAFILPLASLSVHAAETVTVERYHYGMQLDVQKVLALHEAPAQSCQVVDARMDYLDSQGRERSLAYVKHAKACEYDN
jgi:hypothetical protein